LQIEYFIRIFTKRSSININYNIKQLAEKLSGQSYSEIETFCTDVLRKAILDHQQANTKPIVTEKLKQWQQRSIIDGRKEEK
jgi:hypothetical protein